jgi:hypothetical protein
VKFKNAWNYSCTPPHASEVLSLIKHRDKIETGAIFPIAFYLKIK